MTRKYFIGRTTEISILEKCYESDQSEFVAIYGRRRVGKTFLVENVLGDRLDFTFTGLYNTSASVQRAQFQIAVNSAFGEKAMQSHTWFEVFNGLKQSLLEKGKEKVAVFLDELPWMDTQKSNFLAAFSSFWNGWDHRNCILKLFVCGSATTWMTDKLIGDRGGLYGRITRPLYLAPFTLRETEEYLNEVKHMQYGKTQVLETYMIFGGIPFYLNMLDREIPFSENVDRLFFSRNAPLRTEYDFLFRSLFKDSNLYRRVIESLSKRLSGQTREEIAQSCHLDGGLLTKILNNLAACDFIRVYASPQKKERGRIYQLTDMFSLFHLRFIQENDGQDPHYWTSSGRSGQKNAWAGYAFEQVCLHHIPQIKKSLGISGILSNSYAWSCKAFTDEDGTEWKGGQIDLVIDRNDQVMNLCEMKYAQDSFVITKEYAEILRYRASLFHKVIKTKKDLKCTFITPFGVRMNMYSDIVAHQIVLEDLFS